MTNRQATGAVERVVFLLFRSTNADETAETAQSFVRTSFREKVCAIQMARNMVNAEKSIVLQLAEETETQEEPSTERGKRCGTASTCAANNLGVVGIEGHRDRRVSRGDSA